MKKMLAAIFPLILCLPGLAAAGPTNKCRDDILKASTSSLLVDSRGPLPAYRAFLGFPRRSSKSFISTATDVQHASGHRRKPVRRLRRHTSAPLGRPRRIFGQRRLHRHRAFSRRQ